MRRLPLKVILVLICTVVSSLCFADLKTWQALLQSYNGQTFDLNRSGQILVPRSLSELQQFVREAVSQGKQIRISGASHSTSSLILSDSSVYLKTTELKKIEPVKKDGQDFVVSVESGAQLGDLSESLAKQGFSLGFAYPAFRGLTIGGLLATGSHGSSRRHTAVSSQTLVEIQMVNSKGDMVILRPEDGDAFRAASVSLGALGVVYKVKLKVMPQFNLKVTSRVMNLKEESLSKFLKGPAQEDYLFVLWFPKQSAAVIESGVISTERSYPGAENVNLGLNQEPSLADHAFGKALALGRKDSTGTTDALLEKTRFENLAQNPRFVVQEYGKDTPKPVVIGPSHKMLLARGTDLKWPYTLTDNSFSFPVKKVDEIMATIQDFSTRNNYSFPIAGISMRFARSAGERGSFLSHIEDGGPGGETYVLAEFLEYKAIGLQPAKTSSRDDLRDQLMETLITRHKVRLHWGKNNDLSLRTSSLQPRKEELIERFENVRKQMDPMERFLSQFVRDLLLARAKEPFFFRDASQVSIMGTIHVEAARKLMQSHGLRPIPIGSESRAAMTISLVNYGMSSFGPYREFVVMIPAQRAGDSLAFESVEQLMKSPPKAEAGAKNPRVANFMVLLVLDGEDRQAVKLGLDLGRELYGYPKELGSIRVQSPETVRLQNFEIHLQDHLYLKANVSSAWWNRLQIPFSTNSYAYTVGRGFLQTERMEVSGKTTLPQSMEGAHFELRAQGPYRKLFEDLDFRPEKWSEVLEMSMKLTEVKEGNPK